MTTSPMSRRTLLTTGGVAAAVGVTVGSTTTPAGANHGGGGMKKIAELTTNYVQHDLSPEGAVVLSGSFTPAGSTIQMAVNAAYANYGTSRMALLLYLAQPSTPGTRIYDSGGQPRTDLGVPVSAYSMGSIGCESGWASTTHRTIELDVDPNEDVTWVLLCAIIGGANTVPTGQAPNKMAITPNGKKGYVTNFTDGTVTAVTLGRPGYSIFNELQPQDEVAATITTGTWAFDVACDDTHAVVTNYLDATNQVSIIDVATDTVLRQVTLASGQNPLSVAITQDGQHALVSTYQGKLYKVTISSGASTSITLAAGKELRGLAVDASTAYVGNFTDGLVHRVAISSLSALGTVNVGGNVVAVRVAHDGTIWSASRSTNKLRSFSSSGTLSANYTLPYSNVNDFFISPPVAPPVVPIGETQPSRTAYVVYDNNLWSEFNIGGILAGQAHSIHLGNIPGATGHITGVAVNDYGEIWLVQTGMNQLFKFLGGRMYCRAASTPGMFYGEYCEVWACEA